MQPCQNKVTRFPVWHSFNYRNTVPLAGMLQIFQDTLELEECCGLKHVYKSNSLTLFSSRARFSSPVSVIWAGLSDLPSWNWVSASDSWVKKGHTASAWFSLDTLALGTQLSCEGAQAI